MLGCRCRQPPRAITASRTWMHCRVSGIVGGRRRRVLSAAVTGAVMFLRSRRRGGARLQHGHDQLLAVVERSLDLREIKWAEESGSRWQIVGTLLLIKGRLRRPGGSGKRQRRRCVLRVAQKSS